MTNPFDGTKFDPSVAEMPPSDPCDVYVKTLNSKCRELIEVCNTLQRLDGECYQAEMSKDISAIKRTSREHGIYEKTYWQLRHEILDLEEKASLEEYTVFVSHHEGGTAIRVNEKCRKHPWDA